MTLKKQFPVWAQLGTKGLRLMNQVCFRWGADGGLMGGGYSGDVFFFFMKKQLNDQPYEASLRGTKQSAFNHSSSLKYRLLRASQ